MKGTRDNIAGTLAALEQALAKTPWSMSDVSRIYLNEAAPVIGDVAMETITETIITESTMIGHNPQTPGGWALAWGRPSPSGGGAAGGAVCRGVDRTD
jgi:diol dehydratase reactivase alpha subunit